MDINQFTRAIFEFTGYSPNVPPPGKISTLAHQEKSVWTLGTCCTSVRCHTTFSRLLARRIDDSNNNKKRNAKPIDSKHCTANEMPSPVGLDVESLHRALQQSFSPEDSLRRPAEELIKELKYVQNSCLMLMRVATESQVSIVLKLHVPGSIQIYY